MSDSSMDCSIAEIDDGSNFGQGDPASVGHSYRLVWLTTTGEKPELHRIPDTGAKPGHDVPTRRDRGDERPDTTASTSTGRCCP